MISMLNKIISCSAMILAAAVFSACHGTGNTTSAPAELESGSSVLSDDMDNPPDSVNDNVVAKPDSVDLITDSARLESSSSVFIASSSSFFVTPISYGMLVDNRDGQVYKTVVIGKQTWMAENLNYQDSRLSNNKSLAGTLYTWSDAVDSAGLFSSAALTCAAYSDGERCTMPDTVRGICPEGWHIPSRDEWGELLSFVSGGKYDVKKGEIKEEIIKVLKSTSGWEVCANVNNCDIVDGVPVDSWEHPLLYLNGTDFYGLAIRPTEYYTYHNSYVANYWLPSSFIDTYNIKNNIVGYRVANKLLSVKLDGAVYTFDDSGLIYAGVRCVQDSGKTTGPLTLVQSSGSQDVESSSSITSELVDGILIDHRDEESYKTVTIGTQTWMAENLNYKAEGSYCYDDDASNCAKYGRLYTWAAAMDSTGVWSLNGKGCGYEYGNKCSATYPVRGVCPEGWHLPTETEFEILIETVGGKLVAGKALKSSSGWSESINDDGGNGTDDFGFSALPVGYGYDYDKFVIGFMLEGEVAYFWSSTDYGSSSGTAGVSIPAASMLLSCNYDDAVLTSMQRHRELSVRCLKD